MREPGIGECPARICGLRVLRAGETRPECREVCVCGSRGASDGRRTYDRSCGGPSPASMRGGALVGAFDHRENEPGEELREADVFMNALS